jgi:hypothetical protein
MVGPGIAEMLGYETGGHLTYQNVQSRSLHLLIYTVDKWIKDLERCLSDLFVTGPQSVEFDRAGLLRMTSSDRWQVYTEQLQNGARTINEVRNDENMQPVAWGDEPYLATMGHTGTAAAEEEQIKAQLALLGQGPAVVKKTDVGKKTKTPQPGAKKKTKIGAAPKIAGLTTKHPKQ